MTEHQKEQLELRRVQSLGSISQLLCVIAAIGVALLFL